MEARGPAQGRSGPLRTRPLTRGAARPNWADLIAHPRVRNRERKTRLTPPAPAHPIGAHAIGAHPIGAHPLGAHPLGAHPVGAHDVGGRDAPPVVKDEHAHDLWERRVDAMMMLLTHPSRRLLVLDELRRNVEALGPGAYETMGYYERWCAAIANAMIDRGVVTSDELGRRMAEVEARDRAMRDQAATDQAAKSAQSASRQAPTEIAAAGSGPATVEPAPIDIPEGTP